MTAQRDEHVAVAITNVSRTYTPSRKRPAVAALQGVSLTVNTGESLALLGPNGSGKSTLLRTIATLDTPDSGDVTILGVNAGRAIPAIRARIGVLFQSPSIDTLLTVRENLLTHAALFNMRPADARAAAEACAQELGIADRLADRAGELSGGLLRRADLARALIHNPDLLILDEPTTGLDPGARRAFLDALDARRIDRNLTIVMSTHLLDEADRADRVALLSKGRVVGDGTREELCDAIGAPLIIETDHQHADELQREGLEVTISRGLARAPVDTPRAREIADRLIALPAPVRIGPPTLDDVYEKLTGETLDDEQAHAEATP